MKSHVRRYEAHLCPVLSGHSRPSYLIKRTSEVNFLYNFVFWQLDLCQPCGPQWAALGAVLPQTEHPSDLWDSGDGGDDDGDDGDGGDDDDDDYDDSGDGGGGDDDDDDDYDD